MSNSPELKLQLLPLLLLLLLLLPLLQPAAMTAGAVPPSTERPLCQPGQPAPPNRFNSTQRLAQLRAKLNLSDSKFYLQMDRDRFLAGPQPHEQFIGWISGFKGSSGVTLISGSQSMLFTDTRYTVQGDQELDCDWLLYDSVRFNDWLAMAERPITLLTDPQQISARDWQRLQQISQLTLQAIAPNPVDELWQSVDRPAAANQTIYPLPQRFIGESWAAKVRMVQQASASSQYHCLSVTALDETAYLLNLRADVVAYKPYFPSRAVVCRDQLLVFLDDPSISQTNRLLRNHFAQCESGTCPEFFSIANFSSVVRDHVGAKNVSLNPAATPQDAAEAFAAAGATVLHASSPISEMKAVKSVKESVEFANCSLLDSAALVAFLHDMEGRLGRGESHSELSAAELLRQYRSGVPHYRGLSFETIAAAGPNAAVVHYRPVPSTDRKLSDSEVFLLDSGGQYLGCTTDVTRTMYYGITPPAPVRAAYTRVLAGVIDLFRLTWPANLQTVAMDAFARHNLWAAGQNYGHGTGHGIGQFLNVHEGPNGIGRPVPLQLGNFQSIEPGFYLREAPGRQGFGIRLETITGVRRAVIGDVIDNSTAYLQFAPVTFVPFEPKLIDYDRLDDKQLQWLNWYHQECYRQLSSALSIINQPQAFEYVRARTVPVIRAANVHAAAAAATVAAAAAVAGVLQLVLRL